MAQNNKTSFLYALYSVKKLFFFYQSERTQGPIYIISKTLV